jgi:hypothetical protein
MNSQDSLPDATLFCPSAHPAWPDSLVLGVLGGNLEAPRLTHFPIPLEVTDELLEMSAPAAPTEAFRFAAPCLGHRCEHFRDQRCGLASEIVQILPAVLEHLPVCGIRSTCRWWQQQGRAACMRCPQIVTHSYNPSPQGIQPATPATL